jgi:hypothetical protein
VEGNGRGLILGTVQEISLSDRESTNSGSRYQLDEAGVPRTRPRLPEMKDVRTKLYKGLEKNTRKTGKEIKVR